jgi:hypothetical protein
MEIPIAVAVGAELSEVYELKQKQDELFDAEQDLERVLSVSSDFFATTEERDATYADIQANLSAVYEKPFMNKIASAFSNVKRCKDAVEWASESVVDTSLTPAQVKAQIKQLLRHTQEAFSKRMDERLLEMNSRIEHLEQELATETRHRKAFQAKFKNFYEEIMVFHCRIGGPGEHELMFHAQKVVGIYNPIDQGDTHLHGHFIYKRAGLASGGTIEHWMARKAALDQFKPTHFDGTDP